MRPCSTSTPWYPAVHLLRRSGSPQSRPCCGESNSASQKIRTFSPEHHLLPTCLASPITSYRLFILIWCLLLRACLCVYTLYSWETPVRGVCVCDDMSVLFVANSLQHGVARRPSLLLHAAVDAALPPAQAGRGRARLLTPPAPSWWRWRRYIPRITSLEEMHNYKHDTHLCTSLWVIQCFLTDWSSLAFLKLPKECVNKLFKISARRWNTPKDYKKIQNAIPVFAVYDYDAVQQYSTTSTVILPWKHHLLSIDYICLVN